MKLGWKGVTLDMFIDELEASTTKTRKDSKIAMRRGAKVIMEESKAGAPVDLHNLEDAHNLEIVRLSKDNIELEITIGGEHGGRNVDEYAVQMHEGEYMLGEGSIAKSRSSPVEVGPGFLDRAIDNHQDDLLDAIADTLPGD